MNRDGKIYTIIFTFVITFIFIAVLSAVNTTTKKSVGINKELFFQKALLNAMNIKYSNDNEAYSLFQKQITEKKIGDEILYEAIVNGEKITAIIFSGNGLWGGITGAFAVNENLTKIIGIDFIEQNETPGLGGRIVEPEYKEQFAGEIINDNKIIFSPNDDGKFDNDKTNGAVDIITGATITSKAIEKILNKYLLKIKELSTIK